jgi:hypothetical protein
MGRFYCCTEKKLLPRRIFEEKKFKFTAKFNFSSVPVNRQDSPRNYLFGT